MMYIFLADGFEEVEALAPLDFLRRAGIDTKTVGIGGVNCTGTHGITVKADISAEEISLDENLRGIILPGGMPGAENLDNSAVVQNAMDYCARNSRVIAAICAAPFILGKKGLLNGKNAVCYPGFENYLQGAVVACDGVVTDENIVTARGAGVAWEFAAAITSLILGKDKADEILRGIQWKK